MADVFVAVLYLMGATMMAVCTAVLCVLAYKFIKETLQ